MLHTFPAPFVWWKSIENHREIKETLLPLIKREVQENPERFKVPAWDCEVYSSFNCYTPFLNDPGFLEKVVWNPLDECLSEVRLSVTPRESVLKSIWFNAYEPGFFQEAHNHIPHSFSGIYLLDVNEINTTNFLYNLSSRMLSQRLSTRNLHEGDVIIFPSDLLHYVNPTLTSRVTISFNIETNFV